MSATTIALYGSDGQKDVCFGILLGCVTLTVDLPTLPLSTGVSERLAEQKCDDPVAHAAKDSEKEYEDADASASRIEKVRGENSCCLCCPSRWRRSG